MKAYSNKTQKQKIFNGYTQLRKAAMEEIAVDMVKQTVAIMLAGLKLSGKYSDDELRNMYEDFIRIINLKEVFGKNVCSDEVTEKIVKDLGIDLDRIQPRVGE